MVLQIGTNIFDVKPFRAESAPFEISLALSLLISALKILSPQKRFLGLRYLLELRYWQAIVPDSKFPRTKFKQQQQYKIR